MRHSLKRHPEGGSGPLESIKVEIAREGDRLRLIYRTAGDAASIVWPAWDPSGRTDELWRHTCFEVFIQTDAGYVEFNLSPSGRWASYAFTGYRTGMIEAAQWAQVEPIAVAADHAVLTARIDLPPGARRLAVSAVVEGSDGSKTYWALAHPSDKPDFHHPDSFVLELP
jgi:hypothetical protein